MILLKNKSVIPCERMKQGDVAIVVECQKNHRKQGMILIRGYQHYVDLATGDYYGLVSTKVHPCDREIHPDWGVVLCEPGTELVIK